MDKKILIAIVAVAIIAVAAVAIVMVSSSDDDDDDSKSIVGTKLGSDTIKDAANLPNADSRLWVYGNANEDDTIDEKDVEYLEKVIAGTEKKTILSDANADGEVDEKDVEYVKKIIQAMKDGTTEVDVYYLDYYLTVSKVSWPVKTVTIGYCSGAYTADLAGIADKVVMVDDTIKNYWTKLNPAYASATSYGTVETPDTEKVLTKNPDLFIQGYPCEGEGSDEDIAKAFKGTDVDVMFLATADGNGVVCYNTDRMVVMIAYLAQGDMDNVKNYLDWHDDIIDKIETAAAKITDDSQKKTLYMTRMAPPKDGDANTNLCGKGQVNAIHMEITGAYSAGLYLEQDGMYPKFTWEQIYDVFKKTARDTDGDGVGEVYLMYNGHDGMRQTRDLATQVNGFAAQLKDTNFNVHYMGMAREVGNTPFYVVELAMYLEVLYPELFQDSGLSTFSELFDYYWANFDKTAEHAGIDHYFKDFGVLTTAKQ